MIKKVFNNFQMLFNFLKDRRNNLKSFISKTWRKHKKPKMNSKVQTSIAKK